MHEQLRHRFLGWWSGLISHRPGWVLAIAAAITVGSIAVTWTQLSFQSNRNDLIGPDLWWNQLFIRWQETFEGNSDFYVAIDTFGPAGEPTAEARRRAEQLADALGEALQQVPSVEQVLWRYRLDEAHPRAVLLQPLPVFEETVEQMAGAEPLLASPTPQALIQRAVSQMQAARAAPPEDGDAPADADDPGDVTVGIDRFRRLIEAFTVRLATPADEPVDVGALAAGDAQGAPWQYLSTENDRFLFVRITPRRDPDALTPYGQAIAAVRTMLAAMRPQFPEVAFGLTGIEIIEADETAAATTDSTYASILATVLITALLITAFHSVRTPMMLVGSLLVGIAWSFGFLTLTIGHLQVISVVFTVILLGLGVAFGIHIISRFELVRHRYGDDEAGFRDALRDTLETMGPGLVTGAVTTAAAFATTMLTDFTGVAEMGAIAAAGVILCLIVMCSVFPAMLRLFKAGHADVVRMEQRRFHIFEERWVMPFVRHPRATLVVAGLLTVASLIAITQLRFDYNLLELLPTGVDSVQWQRRIVEQGDQSVWSATSIADSLEEAGERVAAFRELPTVERVAGIGLLFPRNLEPKLAALAELRAQLDDELTQVLEPSPEAPATAAAAGDLVQQVAGLRLLLPLALAQAPASLQPALQRLQASIDEFVKTANALTPEQRQRRLTALQRAYDQWRQRVARQIRQALEPAPPPGPPVRLEDLPPRLLRPYVADTPDGPKYAMEVFPRLPEGIDDPLEPPFLGRFITDLRRVDPKVTGVVVQVYESGELIWTSYVKARLYALVAVFVLVWLDFRSVQDAALSLVPVAAGFAMTFGVMELVGENLNPANIIVLPLMFGIGVDAGVHILHRYRQDPVAQPLGLTAGTGKGITLTSFTTIIGFGSMLIARHRGIASLGFVLAVGIALTLLACWTIMPAWLELRRKKN